MVSKLTDTALQAATLALTNEDADLAMVVRKLGPPPLWQRKTGFATLLHIMLEQQVSLASARATFTKLQKLARPLAPLSLLRLTDSELKACGFSRQKTAYARNIAAAIQDGSLNLARVGAAADADAMAELVRVKGIGPWTAEIYLLMALGRPDVWPTGDLALAVAVQRLKGLPAKPNAAELFELSLNWQPWRAVAARILWHFYLSGAKERNDHG